MWESVPPYGRVCPSVGGCAPVWESVPQCGRVRPSVEGVPQCGRVCPSVGECSAVWEDAPQCGGCAPVWEGAPHCGRVYTVLDGQPVTMLTSHFPMNIIMAKDWLNRQSKFHQRTYFQQSAKISSCPKFQHNNKVNNNWQFVVSHRSMTRRKLRCPMTTPICSLLAFLATCTWPSQQPTMV